MHLSTAINIEIKMHKCKQINEREQSFNFQAEQIKQMNVCLWTVPFPAKPKSVKKIKNNWRNNCFRMYVVMRYFEKIFSIWKGWTKSRNPQNRPCLCCVEISILFFPDFCSHFLSTIFNFWRYKWWTFDSFCFSNVWQRSTENTKKITLVNKMRGTIPCNYCYRNNNGNNIPSQSPTNGSCQLIS